MMFFGSKEDKMNTAKYREINNSKLQNAYCQTEQTKNVLVNLNEYI